MSDPAPIEAVLEAYRAAVDAKDVEAFVAIFSDRVRVFDMWGRWSYDGIDEWRAMATDWFGSLGDERVRVDFQDVEIIHGDEIAFLHAFVTFTGLSADGEELRSLDNRLTWGLSRLGDGTWKVLHEHTSAPVDMETGKVTLER
ncbi:MAG TPA: nuclear transport factor 2 family protein [Gaiellaceae bacterium]|nr:nuclear transport factor 2 family protein [Gaiellaceae bacterium]